MASYQRASNRRRRVRASSSVFATLSRARAAEARVAELETQLAAYRSANTMMTGGRLSALLAICSALLVTHDVEMIQQLVVRQSSNLFPGTSGALLFLADADAQRLLLRAASNGPVSGLAVLPGRGLAGRAYMAPRPMLMSGPELEEALGDLDAEQIKQVERLIKPWPPASALLAPLRSEGQRIGALVLYGSTHAHMFLPRDLPFVQALADLSAVAISERRQRARAVTLQRDLDQTQSLHAEAQARLDAAQAQLLQSAKLAAVGELAASVAHEINNPLYAARNSLYLVEQDLPIDAPQRAFLSIAQTELGRIARIITRMRDFYRPARDELEPTDVNLLLAETVELVQTHLRHGKVDVTTGFEMELPELIAHADQLRQVFLNLILNACDAMPNGGTLHIDTTIAEKSGQHNAICIHVADTGVGISPEHRKHLFEPFYTTKPHGTGLGLAISAHIVTQHGGSIDVESLVGVGTTFTITLPIHEEEQP